METEHWRGPPANCPARLLIRRSLVRAQVEEPDLTRVSTRVLALLSFWTRRNRDMFTTSVLSPPRSIGDNRRQQVLRCKSGVAVHLGLRSADLVAKLPSV